MHQSNPFYSRKKKTVNYSNGSSQVKIHIQSSNIDHTIMFKTNASFFRTVAQVSPNKMSLILNTVSGSKKYETLLCSKLSSINGDLLKTASDLVVR